MTAALSCRCPDCVDRDRAREEAFDMRLVVTAPSCVVPLFENVRPEAGLIVGSARISATFRSASRSSATEGSASR